MAKRGSLVEMSPTVRLSQIDADIKWFDEQADDVSLGGAPRVTAKNKATALRDQRAALLHEIAIAAETDMIKKAEGMLSLAVSSQSWQAAARLVSQIDEMRRKDEEAARAKRAEWGEDLTDDQLYELVTEMARALPLPMRRRLAEDLSPMVVGG